MKRSGDELATPGFAHAAVARQQTSLAFNAAEARAAGQALRSQPRTLSIAPPARQPVAQDGRVVAAQAAPDAPATAAGARVTADVTYYYCQAGPTGPIGDGGGFCGRMANGQVVHSGAAACSAQYLGQRFRILGDPTGRTYTCADTGSAVHGEHRDIWFNTNDEGARWQAVVGLSAVIQVLP